LRLPIAEVKLAIFGHAEFTPFSKVNPNRVLQSLIAALVGLDLPFVCTETHELGEEITAAYLYQVHPLPPDRVKWLWAIPS
jgi:hypothetical protein